MSISENILFYLNKQSRTQAELANAMGISKQVANKIVKGHKAVKVEELIKISEFLNISLEDLAKKSEVHNEEKSIYMQMLGEISNKDTVEYVVKLVDNLLLMNEEIEEYGIKS